MFLTLITNNGRELINSSYIIRNVIIQDSHCFYIHPITSCEIGLEAAIEINKKWNFKDLEDAREALINLQQELNNNQKLSI